jgi:hypothetical protein
VRGSYEAESGPSTYTNLHTLCDVSGSLSTGLVVVCSSSLVVVI